MAGILKSAEITDVGSISGMRHMWSETLGDPGICIAILDGPADTSHPSLVGARITHLETVTARECGCAAATQHGTHVASVILGEHSGPVKGVAPRCRALLAPIFRSDSKGSLAPCSQLDLARAIQQCVEHGAHVINISGGQLEPSGEAYPLLADTIRFCSRNNVLIVAATGNDGCNCLHVPGASPSVLAVGAMNAKGEPLEFSNWGEKYSAHGVLAPGSNILGARSGGGTAVGSGTSYSTAIVSGVAALLLSLELKYGRRPDADSVRSAILSSTIKCEDDPVPDCRRLLGGRLSIQGAMSYIMMGGATMPDEGKMQENSQSSQEPVRDSEDLEISRTLSDGPGSSAPVAKATSEDSSKGEQGTVAPNRLHASTCSCGDNSPCTCRGTAAPAQLVFSIGQLGFAYACEADRDSIMQHMNANPDDASHVLAYLEKTPWDSATLIWTLNLDATTIYSIRPTGAFASEVYQRLRHILKEQLTEGVERISIAGVISGQVKLMSGQTVPVIEPDLRCMYSWSTGALIRSLSGERPTQRAKPEEHDTYARKTEAIRNFLDRVYYDLRGLGLLPGERAIKYAATNAMNVAKIFELSFKEDLQLDTIDVERSPICRPDSDCWDAKLTFFKPKDVFQSRRVYRFTVDVSRVCPVMVGPVRSWYVR
jgi:cyanobactin maturation PatA/PatG family protease